MAPYFRWARSRAAVLSVLCVVVLLAGGAGAVDVDQIAVIEDNGGDILPASGFCSFLYPNGLCLPKAGLAFYADHPDNYDILIFATNKPLLASEKAGYPLRADAHGIGLNSTPWSYQHFGSQGRLMQAVDLGSLQSMPDDPEDIFDTIPISGLEVIGHEIGHHWLAYATVDLDDGRGVLDIIRGHGDSGTNTHWSCWFNSDSVMYGGMLTDKGDGTFTDVNGPRRYSNLDQYMMGLRTLDEVGPLWFVAVDGGLYGCEDWPQARGVAHDITGDRIDFSMTDVVRAMGTRDPPVEPCHLKAAFVFVHSPGNPPGDDELAKLERYRTALEGWYAWATGGRGSLDTSLDGCGTGTATCPGQPSAQCASPPDDGSDGGLDGGDQTGADAAGGDPGGGDPDSNGSGGCGCSATGRGPAPGAALLVIGLLALRRRRRFGGRRQ